LSTKLATMNKPRGGLVGMLRGGLALATRAERTRAALLAVAIFAAGIVDMVALGMIMPFVALLMDPAVIERHAILSRAVALMGNPPIAALVPMVGLACLVLVTASGAAGLLLQRAISWFTARCQLRLARSLMTEVLRAPMIWHVTHNSTQVAYSVQQHVLVWARELILKGLGVFRDVMMVALPAGFMLAVTPLWGLLSLFVVAIAVGLVLRWAKPKIVQLAKMKNDAHERANVMAQQALAGVKDVKVSGREDAFVDAFARSYGTYSWGNATLSNWHMVPTTAILLAGQIGLFVVALTLWWFSSGPAELASQLALLVMVTSRVLPAANRLSAAATTFFGAAPSVQAILDLRQDLARNTNAEHDVTATPIARPWQRIELAQVGFAYPQSDRESLQDVSLSIEARRAYGVVGGSGAGKSTLVDIVAGLLTPTNGELRIDGRKLEPGAHRNWQSKLSYVSQQPFLSDDTLRSNIAFGVGKDQIDSARLGRAIDAAGLSELVAELPDGLDTVLGDRGVRLSGGQRQRVAIARALYDDVDLLILDEATSALDTVTERQVQDALEGLTGRIATLTVAHRLSTIRHAERIFVLDRGRLVGAGSWDELLGSSPIFRALVDAQSRERAA
jgi:ABC-type multidrug transport system fused ATPase/permease subunit